MAVMHDYNDTLTYHEQRAALADIAHMYSGLADRAQRKAALHGSPMKASEAAAYKRKVLAVQMSIDRLDAEKAKAEAVAKYEQLIQNNT